MMVVLHFILVQISNMETVECYSRQTVKEHHPHFRFGVLDGEVDSEPAFLPLFFTPVIMQETRGAAGSCYLVLDCKREMCSF